MTTSEQDPFDVLDPADFAFTRAAYVDAPPQAVYDLVSDVAMVSRWSPNASDIAYDEGSGPCVGAWFQGRNRKAGKEWTTRSQIIEAEPGSSFAFVVGGAEKGIVRWRWNLSAQGHGTLVEQSWQLLRIDPVLGGNRSDLNALRDYMARSVEVTLASLARWIAENPRAVRQDFRPKPQNSSTSVASPMSVAVGCHSGQDTMPGARMSRPSKNPSSCWGERRT
jgi:uncharacterized protein YndB with AHSA1/START domain